MVFFDSLINEVRCLFENYNVKKYSYDSQQIWQEEDFSHIILQRDTACELDGTGFNLVTTSPVEDGVWIIGDDICDICGKRKFARICFLEVKDNADEQKCYNLIRKIDYVKYHFFPNGYMLRSASRAHKEGVRVSLAAVKDGISFRYIGNLFINKFKQNPSVRGVKVIFITDTTAQYTMIDALAQKSNEITEALNHIVNNIKFDCDTCNLKAVCDEVEGMKELHFKKISTGNENGKE